MASVAQVRAIAGQQFNGLVLRTRRDSQRARKLSLEDRWWVPRSVLMKYPGEAPWWAVLEGHARLCPPVRRLEWERRRAPGG
jgi:hypothetical protein